MLPTCAGCVGLVANLIHAGVGNKVPAKFAGLTEKRVAVVCVSRSSMFGPSEDAHGIAQRVQQRLQQNVPKIQLVDQREITDWIDHEGWDEVDYREVGGGVDAQMVIGIDILSFSLHEGNTMYRGRSDMELTVFDMDQGGKVVWNEAPPPLVFPVISGPHITETTEAEFRRCFLDAISDHAARSFYAYERSEDFGRDPTFVNF
ncbi:MAG TPA: hypothetical protein VIY86_12850 [Pirellulaceae bacterium]